ncbi:MAG: hypothetical protein IKC69_07035, partial [Clostridia bacterium]|nr:hypothetical protein [Clostridia bacterium]
GGARARKEQALLGKPSAPDGGIRRALPCNPPRGLFEKSPLGSPKNFKNYFFLSAPRKKIHLKAFGEVWNPFSRKRVPKIKE